MQVSLGPVFFRRNVLKKHFISSSQVKPYCSVNNSDYFTKNKVSFYENLENNSINKTFFSLESPKVNFRGKPEKLYYRNINSYIDAIALWDVMAKQQFSDSNDDYIHPEYKTIRMSNYDFLNNLHTAYDKEKFVEYFKETTKFPNLDLVSKKIENEFKRAIIKSEYINNTNSFSDKYDILCAGYNPTCSVGIGSALPGSDLDGGYIIIKGDSYDDKKNEKIVSDFKKELWFNTDARILSYNHPDSFPQVYTLKQIKNLTNTINSVNDSFSFYNEKNKIINQQKQQKEKYNKNYVEANPYFFSVIKHCSSDKYTKEDIKNFAFFVESFMNGKVLYNKNNSEYENIFYEYKNNDFFENVNLSQIKALKENSPSTKRKIIARNELVEKFNTLSIDEQYKIVKNIIMASSEDNEPSIYFEQGENLFAPLLEGIKNAN